MQLKEIKIGHRKPPIFSSIISHIVVIMILCALAALTDYNNQKLAYNNARLVEMSSGSTSKFYYETADRFFSLHKEPLQASQKNAGMTWSIRLMGVPFTDPIAAISVLVRRHSMETGFALGLLAPLSMALLFGRVFCSYICPASLMFFFISRIRKLLLRWFLFPEWSAGKGLAWGVLAGGLAVASIFSHGVWSLILPYFAIGQTVFHGLAMGSLSFTVASLVIFAMLDLFLGKQFTCRYVCPTGRLLGFIGTHSPAAIRRKASDCLEPCTNCQDVCPMQVNPKLDETVDCSMCGECMVVCPTQCLSLGWRHTLQLHPKE